MSTTARNPAFLAKKVREALRAADRALGDYESYLYTSQVLEQQFAEELVVATVKILNVKVRAALEALGMPQLLEAFAEGFAEYSSDLSAISFAPVTSEMFSPVVEYMRDYVQAIEDVAGVDPSLDSNEAERNRLERLLSGTAKFINDRNLDPRDEGEVCRNMYSVFTLVFPDTVPQVPIPKVTRCYKPDFGIASLRTAIEYKFCDSLAETRSAVAGIFEDMAGYEGYRDWEYFYAVFYMTKQFLTAEQIAAEFALAKTSKKWKPIVVIGRGGRVSKHRNPPLLKKPRRANSPQKPTSR